MLERVFNKLNDKRIICYLKISLFSFIHSFTHSLTHFNQSLQMSKKLGFNISDILSQPVTLSVSPTTSSTLSPRSDLIPSSNEYQHERQIESSSTTVSLNETNHHLSNYEQLMRASSIYRNQDYSLLPIVNGTYPWIQTDSILKDRFSCKFISFFFSSVDS